MGFFGIRHSLCHDLLGFELCSFTCSSQVKASAAFAMALSTLDPLSTNTGSPRAVQKLGHQQSSPRPNRTSARPQRSTCCKPPASPPRSKSISTILPEVHRQVSTELEQRTSSSNKRTAVIKKQRCPKLSAMQWCSRCHGEDDIHPTLSQLHMSQTQNSIPRFQNFVMWVFTNEKDIT